MIAARVASLVVLVTLLTACGGDSDGPDPAPQSGVQTLAEGELTACIDTERPPFAYTVKDELGGFEVELLRAIGERLDLRVTVKHVAEGRILASVARSMCDVGAATIPTSASESGVELSSPYLAGRSSLLVRKVDAGRLTHVGALRGKVIGIRAGSAGADQARAEGAKANAVVQEFSTAAELIDALTRGAVHGVVQEVMVNAHEARTRSDVTVTQVLEPSGVDYGFALRKANVALRDAVNFALAALRTDGAYERLLQPYEPPSPG